GVGLVLIAFHGQAQALLLRWRIDQLGQQAAAVALLRIGPGARAAAAAGLAHVLRLLPLAVADRDHSRPPLAAQGDGGAAEQPVPVAFDTQPGAEPGIAARLEVIRR